MTDFSSLYFSFKKVRYLLKIIQLINANARNIDDNTSAKGWLRKLGGSTKNTYNGICLKPKVLNIPTSKEIADPKAKPTLRQIDIGKIYMLKILNAMSTNVFLKLFSFESFSFS